MYPTTLQHGLGKAVRPAVVAVLMTAAVLWLATGARAGAAEIGHGYFSTGDGVRLHFLVGGEGHPLVFLTGWTIPARIWMPQLTHFSATHRVIALDPRAHGRSEAPPAGYDPRRQAEDIADLLRHLRLERPVLVAWSLGVLEALAYVHFHGDGDLAAVVLVDNSVGEQPPPVPKGLMARLRADRAAALDWFVRDMFRAPQPEPYLRALVAASQQVPEAQSMAMLTTLYPRGFWREALYTITVPLLYVVTPEFAGQAKNVKRNRPRAWTAVFEQAGHALFVDEPVRFNRLLERFLRSTSGN